MTRPVDARLIHLVASRYREMQGLVTMSDAIFPVLLASGLFISSNDTVILWYCLGCLVCFAASMIWLRPRILAYYAARFGRVSTYFAFPLSIVMLQGLTAGSTLAEMHVPELARCLAILALLGGWPAWIVVRDWPYRGHWAPPVAAALGAAFPLAARPLDEHTMAVWWMAVGLSLAGAGWGDHRLLSRTLLSRESRAPVPDEA